MAATIRQKLPQQNLAKQDPPPQVFKNLLQLLKQVQDTDSKFLSKSHETRKKSIALDKSNKGGLAKLPYATNSTKAD